MQILVAAGKAGASTGIHVNVTSAMRIRRYWL
jgi:hypothetical protein